MDAAAKKCVKWAIVALVAGIVLYSSQTILFNALLGRDLYEFSPTLATIASSALWAVSLATLLLAPVLVGAAVVINVLGPRLPARDSDVADAGAESDEATGTSDDARPDARTLAERSLYEPNA